MTRAKASDKVRKLLALARDPAATQAEAALARSRADDLIARFSLHLSEYAPAPARRPVPQIPQPAPFYATTTTGTASANHAFAGNATFHIHFGGAR